MFNFLVSKKMKNSKKCLKTVLTALICTVALFAACDKKNEEPKSSECNITVFSVDGKTWAISGENITYAYESAATEGKLTPNIILSEGATVDPPANQEQDFFAESGVTYTVTAEDGVAKKTYIARATRTKYSGCSILVFKVNGEEWDIAGDSLIVSVFDGGTEENELTPEITLSSGATIDPPAGQPQNFFIPGGVKYTVTSEDGATTKVYAVRARKKSSDCSILSFTVDGVKWRISEDSATVTYTFPAAISSAYFAPVIELSTGAKIDPGHTGMRDLVSDSAEYTVIAEDGTQKTYYVKATAVVIADDKVGADGCTWTITGVAPNMTLIIGGTGSLPDYTTGIRPPWEEKGHKNSISTVIIEDGVKNLGNYTFSDYNDYLTSVTVGNSVTTIGALAFQRCYKLSSVTLGNSVTNIRSAAFFYCGLTTVVLPASVEVIEFFAFGGNENLSAVTNHSPVPQTDFGADERGELPFGTSNLSKLTLIVPEGSVEAYRAANVWNQFGSIVSNL
jgi:hypothetical protein